jgi:hypothetical protein
MLRKIHGTNSFHIKLLDRTNIKCQNGQVLPAAQVFYFNGQAFHSCWDRYGELFKRYILSIGLAVSDSQEVSDTKSKSQDFIAACVNPIHFILF